MPNHRTKIFNRIRKLTTIEEFTPETMGAIAELEELQYELIHTRLVAGTLANPIPFPDQLPYGFRAVGNANVMSKSYLGTQGKSKGLLVIASLVILEEKAWYHVSFSREHILPSLLPAKPKSTAEGDLNSTPTYSDLKLVRKHWFGDLWAIQIFPPESEHVNIADFCLHLWHCLDEFPMPKFSVEGHI